MGNSFLCNWLKRLICPRARLEEEIAARLRHKELVWRYALESSGIGFWDWDIRNHVTRYSNVWMKILGYEPGEISEQTSEWMRLTHPDDLPGAVAALNEYLQGGGEYFVYEQRLRCKDGSWKWIQTRGAITARDGADKPTHAVGTITDITKQKEAEEQYLSSARRLNTLVELSPFGIARIDATTNRFIQINPKFAEIVGYSMEEIMRSDWKILSNPENLEENSKHVALARESRNQTFKYSRKHQKPDGTTVIADVTVQLLDDGKEKPALLFMLEDVTERETALARDRHLAAILDNAQEAVVSVDDKHIIRYFNEGASKIFGYTREEVIGQPVSLLIPPEWAEKHQEAMCAFARTGDPDKRAHDRQPIAGRRKDGTVFPAQCSISVSHTDDGTLFTVILSDTSKQQAIEQKLKESNVMLELKVRKRTHDLEIARQRAEEASQSKSLFLSNMSHEIRTPLNSILGMSHLVGKTSLTPKQQGYLNAIEQSGRHLRQVIDNILDFSKMEAGQFRLDSYDFRFNELEKTLLSIFPGLIREKQLQLVVAFDPTIPDVVKGDLQRLNQVLYNLVGNAIKFTKQGEVRVNARLLSAGESDMVIHFEVNDTGIGIPPDQLPRIFKLFEQFDNSITREYGGTGLGLPIAMELVELMGGEMGVHSEYGKGTQFWFTSTLRKGDPTMLAAVENESDLPNSLLGMKILLAEDNPFNQQVATDLLEQEGAEVHLARNGSEAVDLASRFRFDCILMDMQMPVMGGIEASRTIRTRPALAQVPIIAMTANASLDDRNQCLEAGMNDFITKPVRPALLFSAILRQIHRSSGATEEPVPLPETPTAEGPVILDPDCLPEMVGSEPERVIRFARKFLETAEVTLREMENAIKTGSTEELSRLGHSLKSSARTVGAMEMADISLKIEALGNEEKHPEITQKEMKALVCQLQEAYSRAHSAITRMVESLEEERLQADNTALAELPSRALQVLVVDDEEFQLQHIRTVLEDLNIRNILTAGRGKEAFAICCGENPPDLIICDLQMPWMDGVELLRKLGSARYGGGVILLSGAGQSQLKAAALLARQMGLRLLATLQKPLKKSQLQSIVDGISP